MGGGGGVGGGVAEVSPMHEVLYILLTTQQGPSGAYTNFLFSPRPLP